MSHALVALLAKLQPAYLTLGLASSRVSANGYTFFTWSQYTCASVAKSEWERTSTCLRESILRWCSLCQSRRAVRHANKKSRPGFASLLLLRCRTARSLPSTGLLFRCARWVEADWTPTCRLWPAAPAAARKFAVLLGAGGARGSRATDARALRCSPAPIRLRQRATQLRN